MCVRGVMDSIGFNEHVYPKWQQDYIDVLSPLHNKTHTLIVRFAFVAVRTSYG